MEKRTVFILMKKTLLKIKSCGFRPNNARFKKMLTSKIVHLKKIYHLYFDHFLIGIIVFLINMKNGIKIVNLKKIYNFDFDHFLIKRTVFVLIVKNVIENQKFNFPDKLCEIRNKC